MPRKIAIDSKFAEMPEGSEGGIGIHPLPPSLQDDDDARFIEMFERGIAAMGEKDDVVARELGITFQKVSDYRNAKRTLAGHRVMRLARKNRAAGIAMVRFFASLVGGLQVVERGRVGKSELRKQVEMSFERNPTMLRAVLADAAEALGIDEEEAASVWDGPTLVDAVAK